jgi:hypothetical protein
MKTLTAFAAGVALTMACSAIWNPPPKYTSTSTGWKVEHIALPSCPDSYQRNVDLPERDEVDAETVTCSKSLPNSELNLDAHGRTIN